MSSRENPELVAMGGDDHTKKRDNRDPHCNCPPWRYCPFKIRPTNPDCPTHGGNHA